MRAQLWRRRLLICWSVLIVTGKLVAASEQAGIRLEVPGTAHPGDVITVKVIPVAPMNSADLKVMVLSDSASGV